MATPPSPQPPRSRGTQSSWSAEASVNTGSTGPGVSQTGSRLRAPRTLPPWIDSYAQETGPVTADQLGLLRAPASVRAHHSNATPTAPERRISHDGYVDLEDALGPGQGRRPLIPHVLRYGRAPRGGRRWDHLRSAEPVIVPAATPQYAYARGGAGPQSKEMAWLEFLQSSAWGRVPGEDSQVVDAAYLEKLQPGFAQDPRGGFNEQTAKRRSRRRKAVANSQRVWDAVVRSSLSPLIFRLTVMVTSIVALALAGRIFHLLRGADVMPDARREPSVEKSQSIVAIVVDCVAVPYLAYMIWDEYTGSPLGLRSGIVKVSLILLDLVFIIFKAASTALAFQSLVFNDVTQTDVRPLASALAAFLLIALVVWTLNFTVNILRTVERLGGRDEDGRHG